MKITQIRNATLVVETGGVRFLVDPMLSDTETLPPFANTPNGDRRNPLVALPVPAETLADVDAVIVTHTHLDHWDPAAAGILPKTLPFFVQHQADADKIGADGFSDLRLLSADSSFEGVALTKTPGQHGSEETMRKIGDRLGQVCGVIFRHPDEPVLYLAGDTVWNTLVADTLAQQRPDVVVLNAGDAQINGMGSIIMNAADVAHVARAAPDAQIVATHMEAVNHAMLSRSDLRDFARQEGFDARLSVPEDGETLTF
jgi:L-ascorbate metabolism protein UlaG (beta-lactamase superfamily)